MNAYIETLLIMLAVSAALYHFALFKEEHAEEDSADTDLDA